MANMFAPRLTRIIAVTPQFVRLVSARQGHKLPACVRCSKQAHEQRAEVAFPAVRLEIEISGGQARRSSRADAQNARKLLPV